MSLELAYVLEELTSSLIKAIALMETVHTAGIPAGNPTHDIANKKHDNALFSAIAQANLQVSSSGIWHL
jgi:hypothetical protein